MFGWSSWRPSLTLSCRARKTDREERSDAEWIPEKGYAQAVDRRQVAYRVAGSGPVLMLGFNGLATIEAMWEEPRS